MCIRKAVCLFFLVFLAEGMIIFITILACNHIHAILNVICQMSNNLIQCMLKLIGRLLLISLNIKHDLIYKTGVKPIFTFAEYERLNYMVNCDYEIIWCFSYFFTASALSNTKVLTEQRGGRGQFLCSLEIRSPFSWLFHMDVCNSEF